MVPSTSSSHAAKPQLGVFLTHANDLLGNDLSHLAASVQILESAGIDYVVVADHVVLSTNLDGHRALGGVLPFPIDEPYPEPLVTLAAIAAVTTRIRLATGILIAPLRPAVLLAKMAATVAVLSKGRLDLGVGTGWQQDEYDALGVPMGEKVQRMDEGIEACQQLWCNSSATYASSSVSFNEVACAPRPPGGDIPVWFAGRSIPATLRRVARSGAGWLPLRVPDAEELRSVRTAFVQYSEEYGRDASNLGIRVKLPTERDLSAGRPSVALSTQRVDELVALGVTGVELNIRDFATSVANLHEAAEEMRSSI